MMKQIHLSKSTTIYFKKKKEQEFISFRTSPVNSLIIPEPILSSTSPNISQTQLKSDDNHTVSPSRGILSRLVSERDQRKLQTTLSSTSNKDSIDHSLSSSRTYHPENYRSTSCEKTEELNVNQFTPCENTSSLTNTTNNRTSFSHEYPSFGHEYFLDDWTLGRVKILLENQISLNDQLCLNIYNDRNNVQNLVDEQINGCLSLLPFIPPNDIRIELIKLYDHVEMIFPSRALRLYNNDYLLLAILCSNNQCAYIRTSDGWAYSDEESENGSSILIDEISQLIDDSSSDIQHVSEQCRHLLKNACYLYYKRVE